MDSKKILAVVCAVLAVVTAVFGGLTASNMLKKDETPSGEQSVLSGDAANFKVEGAVDYDSAASALESVNTNGYKSTQFPAGITEDMKQAYSINNNLVGWLSIPGAEIDTAILQGKDNDYYLKYDFYERYTTETTATNYGNLYLDYRCSNTADLSKNMVIHGHTTGRASGVPKQAFRSLYDYRDMQHFIENPIIKYQTLYGEHTYKICAVFLSTTQRADDNGYMFNYIYPDMSDNNMVGYINQVKQRMLYETGVSLEPTDKVITLSTCIYDYGASVDTRLVVVGRLLHEGESEEIDASLVKDNPDYRRPQVWYNRNGKVNPYKDTEAWTPSAY